MPLAAASVSLLPQLVNTRHQCKQQMLREQHLKNFLCLHTTSIWEEQNTSRPADRWQYFITKRKTGGIDRIYKIMGSSSSSQHHRIKQLGNKGHLNKVAWQHKLVALGFGSWQRVPQIQGQLKVYNEMKAGPRHSKTTKGEREGAVKIFNLKGWRASCLGG